MAEQSPRAGAPGGDRYVFDTGFQREEERLALGEALWDAGTFDRLAAAGVAPGLRCLEAGAGRGSVARWLADRVGPTGEVLATDLRVDRLKWLTDHGVTVRQLDLVSDDPDDALPAAHYDVIHARLVLQHITDRQKAVDRLCRALRPGGRLVLEDTDTAALFSHPERADFLQEVKHAAYEVMCAAGYHPRCGLLNVELATRAGLVDVHAEGRSTVVRGGTEAARWYILWIEHLRPAMLARGSVTDDRIQQAVDSMADPSQHWLSQVMVTVTARRSATDAGESAGTTAGVSA